MLIGIKTWTRGNPGDGKGYSCRVSLRGFRVNRIWVGYKFEKEWPGEWKLFVKIPFGMFRFHYIRSYGGRFASRSGLRGLREAIDSGT